MSFAKTLHTIAAFIMAIYLVDITILKALYVKVLLNGGTSVVFIWFSCVSDRSCSHLS